MQHRVYKCRTNSDDALKQRLVDAWHSLLQIVIECELVTRLKKLWTKKCS